RQASWNLRKSSSVPVRICPRAYGNPGAYALPNRSVLMLLSCQIAYSLPLQPAVSVLDHAPPTGSNKIWASLTGLSYPITHRFVTHRVIKKPNFVLTPHY